MVEYQPTKGCPRSNTILPLLAWERAAAKRRSRQVSMMEMAAGLSMCRQGCGSIRPTGGRLRPMGKGHALAGVVGRVAVILNGVDYKAVGVAHD